jgi:hypothetical protein
LLGKAAAALMRQAAQVEIAAQLLSTVQVALQVRTALKPAVNQDRKNTATLKQKKKKPPYGGSHFFIFILFYLDMAQKTSIEYIPPQTCRPFNRA